MLVIRAVMLSVVLALTMSPASASETMPDVTFTQADIDYHAHQILVAHQTELDAWYVAVHEAEHRAADEATARRREAQRLAEASRPTPVRVGHPSGPPPGPGILARIRGCESGAGPNSSGDYNAKNPRSSASGAYQFLDGTWTSTTGLAPPARAHSAAVQDQAAQTLYARSGTTPWNASKGCWG